MQVISNVTMYKCDHCGKKQQRAHSMKRHEQFCNHNPNNWHACLNSCKHLEVIIENVYPEPTSGAKVQCKRFMCSKFDRALYSSKAEKMRLMEKYPEDFAEHERMPLQCEGYETEDLNDIFIY